MFHYFLAIISTFTHLGISLCHMDVRENILFPTLHSFLVLLFFFLPCHRLVLPNKKAKLAVCVHVFCVFVYVYVCLFFENKNKLLHIKLCTLFKKHQVYNFSFRLWFINRTQYLFGLDVFILPLMILFKLNNRLRVNIRLCVKASLTEFSLIS